MKTNSESGIALIAVLLILVLLGALLEGFVVSVNSDQSLISTDRQQNQAFYGAMAGLEQLTADLGTLFYSNYRPSASQINALTAAAPSVENISFISPGGGSGYQITPGIEEQRTIASGPYEGMVGLVKPYVMTVTARSIGSAEVRLQRQLQTVAVPVFQFGFFSESDLSFFAGADFNFGGRIHTNGNLFLAQNYTSTLTMSDRVTAVKEVVRKYLANGFNATGHNGYVKIATAPGAYRLLGQGEGSVINNVGSELNDPTWTNLSIGAYNGYVRNGRTGATPMNLPLVSDGARPIDIIRRPPADENTVNPNVFAQRFFSMASLRILLSDTAADITALPSVTSDDPLGLSGNLVVGGKTFALAASKSGDSDFKIAPAGAPLIAGYIKIEMQDADRNWTDVTGEILALGVNGADWPGTTAGSSTCGTSTTSVKDAIIRVQRYRDSPSSCGATTATEFWPNVLFDTREGIFREKSSQPTGIYLGGVIHYIELDIANLCKWLASKSNIMKETGYVVYFSDRRTNRNNSGAETGEYGFEDVINRASSSGEPSGSLDNETDIEGGEDINDNGRLDTYGATARCLTAYTCSTPLSSASTPATNAGVTVNIARKNRPIFFRRALKLVNGSSLLALGTDGTTPYGLTVASENPAYIQGNYNATSANFSNNYDGNHVASAVIADAVTLLSNKWNDRLAFNTPYFSENTSSTSSRKAETTYYRTAIIAGKGKTFTYDSSFFHYDFGTDGGAHNFLRLLENWNGQTLYYKGSIVSLFYSRQAVGSFKYSDNHNVYYPPTRGLNFDVEFLNFSTLPPRTPMFRDVNITGFTRIATPSN